MSFFRLTHVPFERDFNVHKDLDTLDTHEWENASRTEEQGWKTRYEYEAALIRELIKEKDSKTILEIGSGPGHLSQLVQNGTEVDYHLIDKPFAEKYFKEHNFKGTFFVKDIALDLDIDGRMHSSYDLVICNDVLEHLLAPSNVLRKIHSLVSDKSQVLISVPNWRMGHQFLYRGIWDYDNVLYFFYIHGFIVDSVYPSPLQTPDYPRIQAEEEMPEELRRSWNWYFVLKKKL
jgi:2-polyprenyl-3-methyl-5-hydroxy-6-metoxy-1,4-benzoquinol methylase